MDRRILESLSVITDEEKRILNGAGGIDKSLYYRSPGEVDASRLLRRGRQINLRPNVRFIHFPEHTHNYVEFVYMCAGSTTHIIDGQKIVLRQGDLLFMNQHARQEILPAGKGDIAVNFVILPQFFDTTLEMMSDEESPLRDFVISALTDRGMGGNYLYFQVAKILPVQNLIENMICIMLSPGEDASDSRLLQSTMGLLFLTLMKYTDRLKVPETSYDQELIIRLLSYIETDYRTASLSEFAEKSGTDIYSLERLIKKHTGSTFRVLLRSKRLDRACFLLRGTDLTAEEISSEIGYENTSFFYRMFRKVYGCSPRDFRLQKNRT